MDADIGILLHLQLSRVEADHEAFGCSRWNRKGRKAQVRLHEIFSQSLQVYVNTRGNDWNQDERHDVQLVSN